MLKRLYGYIITTQTVAEEFGGQLPEWINVQNPKDKSNQLILETSLDKGEASAIALAMEQADCLLIIDELKGHKLAKQLGLAVTGTLWFLVVLQSDLIFSTPGLKDEPTIITGIS